MINLINTFNQPIFLKEDNELQNKVNILTKLNSKYPNNKKISDDLYYAKQGLNGENALKHELKVANIGMYILQDVNFKYEDVSAQIDFIVITPAKQYFIECKNLKGNIKINYDGTFTRNYKYYGHKKKKNMYSPLTQAERHIDVYKKIWDSNHSLFGKLFYGNSFDEFNVPLVVITNSESIINANYASKYIKQKVISLDQLINYLKNDLKNCKFLEKLSKEDMRKIAERFLNYNESKIINYKKIYLTDEEKLNELRDDLISFRTAKASQRNIPENYIFTNEELENILTKLPKTTDELANVLSDIKIKYHGEEIIKIINELYY